jgi:hypothetical protein
MEVRFPRSPGTPVPRNDTLDGYPVQPIIHTCISAVIPRGDDPTYQVTMAGSRYSIIGYSFAQLPGQLAGTIDCQVGSKFGI